MPTFKPRPFPGNSEDIDILHRLGAAIAIHWNTIPSSVLKVALIEQAVMMEGRTESAASLRERIKEFLEKHQVDLAA